MAWVFALSPVPGWSQGEAPVDEPTPTQQDEEATADFDDSSDSSQPLTPLETDGEFAYDIDQIEFLYQWEHPDHPSLAEISGLTVNLLLTPDGYVKAREGLPVDSVAIMEPSTWASQQFYPSALVAISEAVVVEFNRRGLIGVFVSPHPDDIDEDGEDMREESLALRMMVDTSVVAELRSLGTGDRVSIQDRINHPAHARIRKLSPVKPKPEDTPEAHHDLLHKGQIEDYVFRLNRHPGRRASVAVAAAAEENGVALDYLISENRPWLVFFQVSNTGTKQTDEWRERFGFIHNQLTGNDDILSLDFITAALDESNAFVGSYEAPFLGTDGLRWKLYGSWNEFTASDVGDNDSDFDGESWTVGGELILNIIQHRDFFIDLLAGVRWENIFVDGQTNATKGREDFFLPSVGLQMERYTDVATTFGSFNVEWNMPEVAGTDSGEIERLGRTSPDDDWMVLKWNLSQTFYLEPILNREGWRNPQTPESSTLAHEIAISFKGQYTPSDRRLIPQQEAVVGGFFSVRGYRESAVAGDNAYIASVEYRFHLPRALGLEPDPSKTPLFGQPFRFSPQQVYGRADWDLIFRTFFDVGRSENNDIQTTEVDEVLMGAGAGIELLIKRNINLRVDWGFALRDTDDTTEGSSQVHIMGTILY